MLSHEDNEKLVRVSAGTPMGDFMRLFWIPFMLSKELVTDGAPQQVRLLNETLIAFRDTAGRVGLVDQACPHRGAPLLFARNEDCGIRCVYHGWKFNVEGKPVDLLAEPERSRLKERVHLKAYPCRERNGVVWTYMGPNHDDLNPDDLPDLPGLEWNLVPAENVVLTMRVQECNWLQAIEGELDSAHAAILHGRIDSGGTVSQWIAAKDLTPVFECVKRDFGLSIASRRTLDENTRYWRVNQFLLPFYSLVPPMKQYPELSGHAWVPIDDEHTLCIMFSYHPSQPMYEKSRRVFEEGHRGRETGHASRHSYKPRPPNVPYAKFWTKYGPDDGFQFDHTAQETTWFSGLPGLWVQDSACQSGVAPIYDRTKENLGTSDTGIAMARRILLDALAAMREKGIKPKGADHPETFMVRAVSLTLPKGVPWNEAGAIPMQARLGEDFGYTP
jgi:phthalate 4,5-dioxygenase oxygenase subunit